MVPWYTESDVICGGVMSSFGLLTVKSAFARLKECVVGPLAPADSVTVPSRL